MDNPAFNYGAQGIAGLGFTRLSSIDFAINGTKKSTGRSLLFNLFEANPSEPNFIAFALQRSTEPGDDVEGSFSVGKHDFVLFKNSRLTLLSAGEVDPTYSAVIGNAKIPTWPIRNPYRWNVLVDAIIVNDTITVPTTKVSGAPSNKAVGLMDSGSSYTYVFFIIYADDYQWSRTRRYAPKEICDAIYGNIEGASYDPALGFWKVPCSAEINMAMQIGSVYLPGSRYFFLSHLFRCSAQVFPIHPLDVNPSLPANPSQCIGSFIPQSFSVGTDL